MQSCGQKKKINSLIQEAFNENDDSPMGLQHHPENFISQSSGQRTNKSCIFLIVSNEKKKKTNQIESQK